MDLKRQKQRLEAILADRLNTEGLTAGTEPSDHDDMAPGNVGADTEILLLTPKSKTNMSARIALSKIADGTYGTCEECGGEISQKRLEAAPEAILCIRCQDRSERQAAGMEVLWSEKDLLAECA